MPIEILVFGLWIAALFLVVWQFLLTMQIQKIRRSKGGQFEGGVDWLGMGMLYNGLIDELNTTADEKIEMMEERIDELERLLDERDRYFQRNINAKLRRCG